MYPITTLPLEACSMFGNLKEIPVAEALRAKMQAVGGDMKEAEGVTSDKAW